MKVSCAPQAFFKPADSGRADILPREIPRQLDIHVHSTDEHRREGLGRRMVHEVERKLRALGCPRVNVIVRDDRDGAEAFWKAVGYAPQPSRQFGKDL